MSALAEMREELLGETLGQIKILRDDVAHLSGALDEKAKKFHEDCDLAVLKMMNRGETFAADVKKSAADLTALANQVKAARDTMLGEIAIRQHDEAHKMHADILRKILKNHSPQAVPSWKSQIILVVSSSALTALMCLGMFLVLHG